MPMERVRAMTRHEGETYILTDLQTYYRKGESAWEEVVCPTEVKDAIARTLRRNELASRVVGTAQHEDGHWEAVLDDGSHIPYDDLGLGGLQ